MAGLDGSVMVVLVLACSFGALSQCIVALLARPDSSCMDGDVVFWPSVKSQGEVECESPLADLANDLFTVPATMQSPMFDMQDALLTLPSKVAWKVDVAPKASFD